jgi:hypothetical protein
MGFMTLIGQFHEYKAGSAKLTNYMAGVTVPLGAMTLKASYGCPSQAHRPRSDPDRRRLWCTTCPSAPPSTCTARIVDNDAGLRFTAGGGGKTNGVGGFKSTGYEVGVRHSF